MTGMRAIRVLGALLLLAAIASGAPVAGHLPVVSSALLGGSDNTFGAAIVLGPDGALWVAGTSAARDIPGAPRSGPATLRSDGFVFRLDPATREVLSSVWIGGSGFDQIIGLAFAPDGVPWVAGNTQSADFPGRKPGQPAEFGDVFVARVARDGSRFDNIAVFGSSKGDSASAMCVTRDGDPVVVGGAGAGDFPLVEEVRRSVPNSQQEIFVTRLAGNGNGMVFSTYLGGSGYDQVSDVAESASGSLLVTGTTLSADFPQIGFDGQSLTPANRSFLTEFAPRGGAILRSRLFDGLSFSSIVAEPDGSVVAAGTTGDETLPFAQFRHYFEYRFYDAFLLRLDSGTWDTVAGTYYGGSRGEGDVRVTRAQDGTLWLTGRTFSGDLPFTDPRPVPPDGAPDLFLAAFGPEEFPVIAAAASGGPRDDRPESLAFTADGDAWLFGTENQVYVSQYDIVLGRTPDTAPTNALLVRFARGAPLVRPATPAGFTAVATTPTSVRLAWQPGDASDGGFAVDRAEDGAFERIAVLPAGTTEFVDETARPDQGYTYTVQAVGADGDSDVSPEVRLLTPPSISVQVSEGSFRVVSRRGHGRLDLSGTITPAPDLVAQGLTVSVFAAAVDRREIDIAPGDAAWTRRRGVFSWRTADRRLDWNPATGAFRLRSRTLPSDTKAGESFAVRMTSGGDAGSVSRTWRRVSAREFRTP